MKKDQSGFSVLAILVVLVVLAILGSIGWRIINNNQASRQNSKNEQPTSSTDSKPTIPLDTLIGNLQKQLPSKFDYLGNPQITSSALSTNLLTNKTWYINIRSKNTSLSFSFADPSLKSGLFDRLPLSQQKTLDDQTEDVISYVTGRLEAYGYHYEQPPQAGVIFENDKAGYYASADNQCELMHWHTLPIQFELRCATNADIKSAQASASPLMDSFAKAHSERALKTVEVSPPIIESSSKGNHYALLTISSPDSINTHPTDGPSIWANQGQGWIELSRHASACAQSSTLPADLTKANISDGSAAEAVNKLCAKIGP
jgi:type II secretory pathway pseudopilin PulG